MTTYTTITSKGQITLPAEARRALNLQPGQRVAVRLEGDHLVIEAPQDIKRMRERLRREAESVNTWGQVPTSGDGFAARAEDLGAQR